MKKARIKIYEVNSRWYWKFLFLPVSIGLLFAGPYNSEASAKRAVLYFKLLMAEAEIEEGE